MKYYNYDLAKKIIERLNGLDVLENAALGMQEDWFWTAETIFENGEYCKKLFTTEELINTYHLFISKRKSGELKITPENILEETDFMISGISGSCWATPVLCVNLKDGSEQFFNCYQSDGKDLNAEDMLNKVEDHINSLGCLSKPVQSQLDLIKPIDFEE